MQQQRKINKTQVACLKNVIMRFINRLRTRLKYNFAIVNAGRRKTFVEFVNRKKFHDLRKNGQVLIHFCFTSILCGFKGIK
jgi:hypothetical protein